MLFEYQLKIVDRHNIYIGNVKKLVPNFFNKEKWKVCDSLWKFENLIEARIKTKKIHRVLEFNQSQVLKQYVEFNTKKE